MRFPVFSLALLLACGQQPPLTPEQVDDLQVTASETAHCREAGKASNSYRVYDCCMKAAGLHSGPQCAGDAGHD